MERALDRELLSLALGDHDKLPSPAELQAALAAAEISLFIHQPKVSQEEVSAGWYLHGVASSPSAFSVYPVDRQRRAFQVSAHILDLASQDTSRPRLNRCRMAFGSAIGYLRGDLEPNAMAILRRSLPLFPTPEVDLQDRLDSVALEIGMAVLGFDTKRLRVLCTSFQSQFEDLRQLIGTEDLGETIFGPRFKVVKAAGRIRRFLFAGSDERLSEAKQFLLEAARLLPGANDLDTRWVASHLLTVVDETAGTSIWAALPTEVPQAVKQALVFSEPRITTLWGPQRELFGSDGAEVLDPQVRRSVMSLPTSAGKTLVAQIMALSHVAGNKSSVCYVAPMRSLGREVRDGLRARLRFLRTRLFPEYTDQESAPGMFGRDRPGVEVMTPERLGFLLRNDFEGVLDRFGMFIFDEAHQVADPSRGFNLEWAISMLHLRTRTTDHRIVLLSAALGNRAQVKNWIDPDDSGRIYASDWRGPRRLHAVFSTDADWDSPTFEDVASADWPQRVSYPLHGNIQIRAAEGLNPRQIGFTEPIGSLVFRVNRSGARESQKHPSSTSQYKMNAQVVAAVGQAGPVLTIMSTRMLARQMARAIAELVPASGLTRDLASFVEGRLGVDHPLVPLLQHRVAFHHAGLPSDVLQALEEALRDEDISYLTSTTTLTEGVNLPVRTVVLAETNYEGQPLDAQILGARLINAMGRAGRATKETEGWVIMCKPGNPATADFERMKPADQDLKVVSRIATGEALEALATFEEALASAEDAVFIYFGAIVDDFNAFVWFVMASFEDLSEAATADDIDYVLSSTLGFGQLMPDVQERWKAVAHAVRDRYLSVDTNKRRRWAKIGTSIGSARSLDQISGSVAARAAERQASASSFSEPEGALALLGECGGLRDLFELPESPRKWEFRPSQNSGDRIDLPIETFLSRWISGADVGALATEFLYGVNDRGFAVEQIVDAISEHCEHFLSWTLGVVIGAANETLEGTEPGITICEDLPAFVRHGVDSIPAVELIRGGLRSRAFASRVALNCQNLSDENQDLRNWLQSTPLTEWRGLFGGSTGDMLDLLEFVRPPERGIIGDILAEGSASIALESAPTEEAQDLKLAQIASDPIPKRFGAFVEDRLVAVVATGSHADVQNLVNSGVEFRLQVSDEALNAILIEESD